MVNSALKHHPHPKLHTLSSSRLILTVPNRGDVEGVFAYARQPQASRYLGWRPHRSMAETEAYLIECEERWHEGRQLAWVVRDERAVVGMIDVQLSRIMAGIGYVVGPEFWGRGYATEMLQLVSTTLFEDTVVPSIWAICEVSNRASARVLEKCGYRRQGRLPGYRYCPNIDTQLHDFISYARYRPEDD